MKRCNASVICDTHRTNKQTKSPNERRFDTPSDGPSKIPISTKNKSRLHQCDTKIIPRKCVGYVLISGGVCRRDLIISDWHDIESIVASEVHEKFQVQKSGNQETAGSICVYLHRR